jgi:hypothetical protein
VPRLKNILDWLSKKFKKFFIIFKFMKNVSKENLIIVIGIPDWIGQTKYRHYAYGKEPDSKSSYVKDVYKTEIAKKIEEIFIKRFNIWDKVVISDRKKDFLMSFVFDKVYLEVIERDHRKEFYKRFDLLDEDLLEEMVKKGWYINQLDGAIRQLYDIDYDVNISPFFIFKKEFSTPIRGLGFSYQKIVNEKGKLQIYRCTRHGCAMMSVGIIDSYSWVDESSRTKVATYIGLHELGHIVFGEDHCSSELCIMRYAVTGDVEEDLEVFRQIEEENPELFCSSHLKFLENLKDEILIDEAKTSDALTMNVYSPPSPDFPSFDFW